MAPADANVKGAQQQAGMDDAKQQAAQQALLEQYAAATKTQVVISPADLDPKDRAMSDLMLWCAEQGNIVILRSATILASEPTSRTVQNCKSFLLSRGIHPGQVYAASQGLIDMLLSSSEEDEETRKHKGENTASFSDQQRHLRELVFEAIRQTVSDIHIQVRQTYTKIRMRQHGGGR